MAEGLALWGLPGFLVGAIFWHFIGFWGFVAEIVVGDPSAIAAGRTAAPAAETRPAPVAGACIALVLDRVQGRTSTAACGDDVLVAAAPDAAAPRQDRIDGGHRASKPLVP